MSREGRSGFELEAAEVELRSERAKHGHERRRREGFRPKPRRRRAPQLSRARFNRVDEAWRCHNGIGRDQRGQDTEWLEYCLLYRLYRLEGTRCRTTNEQRSIAMHHAGRGRTTRTVRRVHRRLEAKGLLHCFHEQRWGKQDGRKDRLRVCIPNYVRPPGGEQERSVERAPARPAVGGKSVSPAPSAEIAPPDGGRDRATPAQPASNGSDEEVGPRGVAEDSPEAVPEPVQFTAEQLAADHREAVSRLLRARRGDRER